MPLFGESVNLFTFSRSLRAYGEAVSHVHGMDGFGVRLPVGPQNQKLPSCGVFGFESDFYPLSTDAPCFVSFETLMATSSPFFPFLTVS